ncbi:MAG: ester cyclase [Anaerolineales bacterium]
MSPDENKAIVRRYQEIYNSNQLGALDEIIVADLITHSLLPGLPPGLEGGKLAHLGFIASIPDLQQRIDDLIAERDKVVMRFTASGTHTGAPFMGVPASGRHFTITGISLFRLANGKIVEHWGEEDSLGLLQQLGVMPAPA